MARKRHTNPNPNSLAANVLKDPSHRDRFFNCLLDYWNSATDYENAGLTADEICERVYNNSRMMNTVTSILNKLREEGRVVRQPLLLDDGTPNQNPYHDPAPGEYLERLSKLGKFVAVHCVRTEEMVVDLPKLSTSGRIKAALKEGGFNGDNADLENTILWVVKLFKPENREHLQYLSEHIDLS
jgi:hypothetical protein